MVTNLGLRPGSPCNELLKCHESPACEGRGFFFASKKKPTARVGSRMLRLLGWIVHVPVSPQQYDKHHYKDQSEKIGPDCDQSRNPNNRNQQPAHDQQQDCCDITHSRLWRYVRTEACGWQEPQQAFQSVGFLQPRQRLHPTQDRWCRYRRRTEHQLPHLELRPGQAWTQPGQQPAQAWQDLPPWACG